MWCLFCTSLLQAAPTTVTLEPLALPGVIQVDPWNKASGRLAIDPAFPPAATAPEGCRSSLRVSIDWPRDDTFRFCTLTSRATRGPIPYRLLQVKLWLKGGGDRHACEIHFKDADGKDQKLGLGNGTKTTWQQVTRDIPAGWQQPLTFRSLTWHSWGLKAADGGPAETLLARLEAVIETSDLLAPDNLQPRLLLATSDPHGVAAHDGLLRTQLRLLRWETAPAVYALEERLGRAAEPLVSRQLGELPATGEAAWQGQVKLGDYGCYHYQLRLRAAGGDELVVATSLTRLPPQPARTVAEKLASAIGVNTHIAAPWALLGQMGVHWARDYTWGWLGHGEAAPVGNGLDFRALADAATTAGVNLLPVTSGTFRNQDKSAFSTDQAAIRTAFERLSKAFPEVLYWEIDNEFEYQLPAKRFDLQNYAQALTAANEGLRTAGGAELVLNGTAGIRYGDTAALLKTPAVTSFSVVNSHYYTGTAPPETGIEDSNIGGDERSSALTFLDQLKAIDQLAHAAGKQSWLTEVGWDVTNGAAVGEELQALYLPRVYLLARWVGTDKVFWYYDRDVADSKTKFSTCGLYRLDGSLRPSAVALAALSAQTATTTVGGRVDVGDPDQWLLTLQRPDGRWVVAAWSVEREHPLPEPLRGGPAVDVFGNDCQPTVLSPSVVYVTLDRLPSAWDQQRHAHLESPTVLVARPGTTVGLAAVVAGAELSCEGLPDGVQAQPWRVDGELSCGGLTLAPTVEPGRHQLSLLATGDGWRKQWQLDLRVEPFLTVDNRPYEPGQADLWTVRSPAAIDRVTARLEGGLGQVVPSEFALAAGVGQRLAIVPGAEARGLLWLDLALSNGVRQRVPLRPATLRVPRLTDLTIDGKLDDWPDAALLPAELLAGAPPPGARVGLAWRPDGLVLAAELPVDEPLSGQASSFWDFTNLELFCAPEDSPAGWSASCRQFWFCPEQAGDVWRLAGGRWQRGTGGGPREIPGLDSAVTRTAEGLSLEAAIPAAAFGGALRAGAGWRLGLALRGVGRQARWEAAWPRLKGDGLLTGPERWGSVVWSD